MASSNSDAMLGDVMNYILGLLGLIEAQDWIKFEEIALSNFNTFKFISKSISESEEFNGMTLLHACVRYDSPINLLDQMIKLYPHALKAEDCLGRTPLHVAAGSGASLWVINLLTFHYPQACNIQDEDGKTPLHFACDTTCELFEVEEGGGLPRGPPSLDTVKVLLSGSLDAVTLEDLDEMNAVEYAIVSDASIAVVNLLQRATQRVLKKNKANESSPRSYPTSAMSRLTAH